MGRIPGKVLFGFSLLLGLSLSLCPYSPEKVSASAGLSYHVSFEGTPDKKLRELLEGVSDTVNLEKKPPASINLLKRRVEEDIPLFQNVLRSRGFYDAKVRVEIDQKAEPVQIIFRMEPGLPYLLRDVDIRITGDDSATALKLPDRKELGLTLGEPAENKRILDAGNVISRWIKRQGFPFPVLNTPKLLVDHRDRSVRVTFIANPGPPARFGKTTVTGLKTVDEAFVRKNIPWKEGDPYNADLFAAHQKRLINSGLFSVVRIIEASTVDPDGRLPVTIVVTERKQRTVSAALSYSTDEKLGTEFSWEHRNLFHRGERLDVSANASRFTRALKGGFRKPYFLRDDQSLDVTLRVAKDTPDAYDSLNLLSSIRVDRVLNKEMSVGVGLAFKKSEVKQLGLVQNFDLISLPLVFSWDTSNDLLDPNRGGRLTVQAEPFQDISNRDLRFTKGLATYRHYLQVFEKPRLVLAGRITLGSILGAERNEIPADERFYAGGGGSIRGYAYQSVGPLAADAPIGGRSLMEMSLEIRLKITERFGVVGFLDGGTAYRGANFNTDDRIQWGAGPGLRYYTPIGPVRLDVGFPLNRRDNIDDSFQFYLSIGQAF